MKKFTTSSSIYIDKSKIKGAGRGVFALKDIKKGEIVERCPIIEVTGDPSHLAESILVTYFFYFGKDKERLAVALGFGSIYNHSYTPNAKFKINQKAKTINFVAVSNIKKDTEITFNYYGSSKSNAKKTPLWFEV